MSYLEKAKSELARLRGITNQVPQNDLKRFYQASVDKLSDQWIAGLYDHLNMENPGLMARIDAVNDNLDHIWITVKHGRAGISEFKKALQEWEILHLKILNPMMN